MKGGGRLPAFAAPRAGTSYVVQQHQSLDDPEPAVVHLADCTRVEGSTHSIRPDEARAALTDPTVEACASCRPDSELGMDLA
ncbi:DUF6233 domain-containing protein [Streptomyces sp. enrichment culture]|uniref:DUF6233 domain-containing protein n=1 Tax=Streptomyces sp. enrichment culture TaxID=1795815 RepID=UPI003F572E1D